MCNSNREKGSKNSEHEKRKETEQHRSEKYISSRIYSSEGIINSNLSNGMYILHHYPM